MLTRKQAEQVIEAIKKLRTDANDSLASQVISIYPTLSEKGELVKVGTRINWNGVLKRAAVDLWDTKENNPDNAPILWEDILYRDGIRIIPEAITIGTAFLKDEKGYWGDILYKSLIDNNVWTPSAYPAGWEIVK